VSSRTVIGEDKKKGGSGTVSSPFSSCAGSEGHYHLQKRKITQAKLFILFSSS
jgi:hypothetical protein